MRVESSKIHADFVLSSIEGSEFARCSFQNAEWRDTIFKDATFRQCIFRNTIPSSIQFEGCSFDDSSSASFVGRSKRFSLFSNTEFVLPAQYWDFLSNNFGIHSPTPETAF